MNQPNQYKGINKLESLEGDLGSFQSCMWLVLEDLGLDYLLKTIPIPNVAIKDESPDVVQAAAAKQRKDNAKLELTLMRYIGGEVRDALARNLKAKRGTNRASNSLQA